ncbi:hypothetical protein GJW-30_1_03888 [Variibacter gotjawalensis]|uniref:Uncharacterized protein n=1 Tax=Variibacter gotjawalensis TaxID=1333996 RepID=A0A0S3PZL3_9BRAD|nr:hypothetical protein [Variibacter gotjawalensis]NIK47169.1 hypothetical protein [Variibacter gotjawalensis]RZS49069.1 hypothetical protein EV661_1494 [Variibacter gotjawalensis]BAT61331.1 hypothetical protein GJW-30_1_03888 [Variibacter gotjawalensis]
MPSDVKAIVSGLTLIVAAILAFWSGSPIKPGYATIIMITAVLMVIAMWVFPEAISKAEVRKRQQQG